MLSARDEGEDPIEARRAKKGREPYPRVSPLRNMPQGFRQAYTPTLKGKYADPQPVPRRSRGTSSRPSAIC